MVVVPIQRPWTQQKNPKSEIRMVMPARVRPNQKTMQVAPLVTLSQIGAGWVELSVVLAPD